MATTTNIPQEHDRARPERRTFGAHYRAQIRDTGREARFLIALAFLVTFGIVRGITYAIRYHWLPFLHDTVSTSGLHIHHMVYGIFLLLITGYLALAFPEKQGKRLVALALLYGIGAALTLDEFALWLNLQDVYWAKQGRESVDIAIGAAGFFALLAIGAPFWSALWRDTRRR
jgi:hypothetical protein